jgi:hypothetical protein
MTRYERASLAVITIGFLLVIGSLLATWLQLKEVTEQNRMTVHSQRQAPTLALDRLFVEYPELRPYFYDGLDIDKKNPSFSRVQAVAEMHLDVFDYKLKHAESFAAYQLASSGQSRDRHREVEKTWMRDMLRTSPILRRYGQQRKGWYSPELHHLLEEASKTK